MSAPEKIYLQWHGDADPADFDGHDPDGADVTWCVDPIYEHDVAYVSADKFAALEAERDQLRAELADLKSCACSDCNQEVLQLRAELAKADGQINRCVDQNRYLERLLSEAARDVSIVTFLRCGGWEVLQNPKYWTPENKFFGAIAEAMAEVAMAGGEHAKLCEHGYFLEVAPRSCPKCRTDLDLIQREEIATLKAAISRLREYAGHKPSCWWWRGPNCDCGYDDLIKEIGK